MIRQSALVLCLFASTGFTADRAKNVILFIGDAGGLPTLNAASAYGYGAPQKLFIQRMPNIGLSDTSASDVWVTDSAAGMTAIVTGQKTTNGTLSQTPAGQQLKTILEYAEERGLSTGVISNVNMADATPAACYSHVDSRKKFGDIFSQVWKPRFGDGVDLIFGGGRTQIADSLKEMNIDLDQELARNGWPVHPNVAAVPADAKKAVVLVNSGDFPVDEATAKAIQILSRNSKGYFLMVEWDLHANSDPAKAFNTVVALDKLIEKTATSLASKDTLVIFAADHSFDVRLHKGKKSAAMNLPPNAKGWVEGKFDAFVGTHHTGEEVIVAATGPGAERVKGFFPNTEIFRVMLSAFKWKPDGAPTN